MKIIVFLYSPVLAAPSNSLVSGPGVRGGVLTSTAQNLAGDLQSVAEALGEVGDLSLDSIAVPGSPRVDVTGGDMLTREERMESFIRRWQHDLGDELSTLEANVAEAGTDEKSEYLDMPVLVSDESESGGGDAGSFAELYRPRTGRESFVMEPLNPELVKTVSEQMMAQNIGEVIMTSDDQVLLLPEPVPALAAVYNRRRDVS